MSEENEYQARLTAVNGFLERKDKFAALNASLQNPPVNSKSEELKENNTALVEKVLATLTEADLSVMLDKLTIESMDVLMKYVYKLMGKASNCTLMLKLHAQLVQKAGVASIIKTMTDRKTV